MAVFMTDVRRLARTYGSHRQMRRRRETTLRTTRPDHPRSSQHEMAPRLLYGTVYLLHGTTRARSVRATAATRLHRCVTAAVPVAAGGERCWYQQCPRSGKPQMPNAVSSTGKAVAVVIVAIVTMSTNRCCRCRCCCHRGMAHHDKAGEKVE